MPLDNNVPAKEDVKDSEPNDADATTDSKAANGTAEAVTNGTVTEPINGSASKTINGSERKV